MASNEAQINQVLDLFCKFSLEKLNDEWVTTIFDSEFSEVEPIPVEFEETHCATNFSALFHAQINSLRQWVDSVPLSDTTKDGRKSTSGLNVTQASVDISDCDRDRLSKFWVDFAKIVNVKNLMSFVFYHIHCGQKYDAKEEDRELGSQAASLYFLVLCIRGSNAFRVFHPVLYVKALDLLRLTTKLNVGAVSPHKSRAGPGKGKQRRVEVEDEDDDESDMILLTPNEANKLVRLLNVLLSDFIRLTQRFSLKHSPESIDETISILVDVTRNETHNAHAVFLEKHGAATVTSLVYNAYVALQCICSHLHGNVSKVVTLVLKHFLHNILMVSRGSSDLSVRALGVIRDHSIIFVKYLLTQIKEPAYEGVYILVQHLCFHVPDKADFREKTAQSVVEILRHLPINIYTRLVRWFFKFSHNEKPGHRLFTLEIINKMLNEDERLADDSNASAAASANVTDSIHTATNTTDAVAIDASHESTAESFHVVPVDHPVAVPDHRNILSHKFLLCIIFSRCRDSAATVRSKALALLSDCTLSDNPTISQAMQQIFNRQQPLLFTTPHINNNEVNIESPLEQLDVVEGDGTMHMPNATMVMAMLCRRARDDKVTVRKSALQVMLNLMKLDKDMVSPSNLKVIREHCRDPALLVRKQMVTSMTLLLEQYPQPVSEAWVAGVLPAVLDPENKVQEKVAEMVHQVILGRLMSANRRGAEESNELPWLLLSTITKLSFHKFFSKAISLWSKTSMANVQIVEIAKSHIGAEHNESTWLLLSMLSHCLSIKNVKFAVQYYTENCTKVDEVGWYTMQQVIRVLCNSITSVPVSACAELHAALLRPLTDTSVCVGLMTPLLDLLALINQREHEDEKEAQAALQEWVPALLSASDQHLQDVLFAPHTRTLTPQEEELLFRHIFLLGEAGLLCPNSVNKRMFLMLQSLIFTGQCGPEGAPSSPPHIPSSQTQSSQPPRLKFVPSQRIKAVCVAVLGKLCLQHEAMAKRMIPALGRMLDTNPGPDIKTNIIFTLTDMCVRYATVVDPLMPQVTACLRDPDLEVRRTTLTLLISLLQEDYLKLKGIFFYRILQCLCDEHEEIRDTVVFFLTERLLKRFPKMFSQHFIECIFHYNCFEEHESYNKFTQSTQEKELFSLAGPEHARERSLIYKFMLDHSSDEQRFSITLRLCQDVLGGVVDRRLGPGSDAVLQDALLVLCSDDIKLATLKARPEDDQPTCQEEQAQMAGQAIKRTIISQVVKRHVIEKIIPILISLKHLLQERRSPLMKQLLLYLKDIMRDYKNEVKEILAGDKQLADEIEFDLRKFQEEQRGAGQQRGADQARLEQPRSATPELPPATAAVTASSDGVGENVASPRDVAPSKRVPVPCQPIVSKVLENLSPKKPTATKNNLRKTAVLNSINISTRRHSIAVSHDTSLQTEQHTDRSLRRRRASVHQEFTLSPVSEEGETSTCEKSQRDKLSSTNDERADVSDTSMIEGNNEAQPTREKVVNDQSPVPEPHQTAAVNPLPSADSSEQEARRLQLLRAISTPTRNQSILRNITFVNQSQEVSAIGDNFSLDCTSDDVTGKQDTSKETVVLHFKSPDAYAKDDEFSRLRRTCKRSLKDQKPQKTSEPLPATTRQSVGLFESVEAELEEDSD